MAKAKKPKKMLAVFGRCRRVGRWRLAAKSVVLAAFGTCFLDLRDAHIDGDEPISMKLTVVIGSVRILLPSGAEILPSGMVVLADARVDVPPAEDSHFPLLEIEWTCVLGRLRVLSADVLQEGDDEPGDWRFWRKGRSRDQQGAAPAEAETPTPEPAAGNPAPIDALAAPAIEPGSVDEPRTDEIAPAAGAPGTGESVPAVTDTGTPDTPDADAEAALTTA